MSDMASQFQAAEGFGSLSIRDFILPLFRRKRLLFFVFISVSAASVIWGLIAGPAYSARMEILVNRERQDPRVSTEATTQLVTVNDPVTPEEINSEVDLLSSRDVLEQVVIQNDLQKPSGFSLIGFLRPNETNDDRIARAVKTLAKQLKIANIKDSNLIGITYASPDPKRSYGVLRSLGDLYIAKHVAVHRPAGSYEFFAQETQKYYSDLEASEDRLRSFDKINVIAAPAEQRSNLATQVASSIGNQYSAEQAIAADQERLNTDLREISRTSPRSTTLESTSSNDPLMAALKTALVAAQAKRTQLALIYDSSYPLVQEADQEISEAQTAITQAQENPDVLHTTDRDPTYEFLREDIVKTKSDLSAQRASLIAIKRGIQSMKDEMVNLDQLSLTQQDLQREVKADESNYLLYLGKREQERTSNALDITRIANVAIAVPPGIPALPVMSYPIMVLIGLGAATFISLGAAYTVDYLDTSFHSPAEVAQALGIPVVLPISRQAAA